MGRALAWVAASLLCACFSDPGVLPTGTTSAETGTTTASMTTTTTGATTTTTGTSSTTDDTATTLETTTTTTTTGGDEATICGLPLNAWAIGEVEILAELNSDSAEANPVLTEDELTLLFTSTRDSEQPDLYRASRPAIGEPFEPPVKLDALGLNSALRESRALLLDGGLTVYYGSERAGGLGNIDHWVATRPSLDVPFADFVNLTEINTADGEYDAFLSDDRLRLYYNLSVGSVSTIRVAERPSLGEPFAQPELVGGLESETSFDLSPWLVADERLLFFASRRTANIDIYVAQRAAVGLPFDAPAPVAALNSDANDSEVSLSPSGCEVFFNSERNTTPGKWNLYRATIVASP
ncbi:MAG: PD40 domain-containing protein [Myxococcales bacterium]|nr:PD40 domain-containing protein [Myxococcales bacterium]